MLHDREALRATGRTAQFNVNMKSALKAMIVNTAKEAGVPVTCGSSARRSRTWGSKMLSRLLAYLLACIPAAIGVGFVARYAFVTSDTRSTGRRMPSCSA